MVEQCVELELKQTSSTALCPDILVCYDSSRVWLGLLAAGGTLPHTLPLCWGRQKYCLSRALWKEESEVLVLHWICTQRYRVRHRLHSYSFFITHQKYLIVTQITQHASTVWVKSSPE